MIDTTISNLLPCYLDIFVLTYIRLFGQLTEWPKNLKSYQKIIVLSEFTLNTL